MKKTHQLFLSLSFIALVGLSVNVSAMPSKLPEDTPNSDQTQCLDAPEDWGPNESHNTLTGILQERTDQHSSYYILVLDNPVCVRGLDAHGNTYKVESIKEIQLYSGLVNAGNAAQENKHVRVRGNLYHNSFFEGYSRGRYTEILCGSQGIYFD